MDCEGCGLGAVPLASSKQSNLAESCVRDMCPHDHDTSSEHVCGEPRIMNVSASPDPLRMSSASGPDQEVLMLVIAPTASMICECGLLRRRS